MTTPHVAIFHKDQPFSPLGIHSGAEMGTIHLARALAGIGARATVIGRIVTGSGSYDGARYIDVGPSYDIETGLSQIADEVDALISVTRADVLERSLKHANISRRLLWLQDSALEETCVDLNQLNACSDGFIYVSRALRSALEAKGVESSKGFVIHNGFDPTLFYPRDVPVERHRILFAGALVPEKGFELLIEAFNLLATIHPDAGLWLYGSANLWGRRNAVDPDLIQHLNPRIHFPGAVNQTELADAFSRAALAVIPSLASARLEPFPLTSVEAQACGCPVVVSSNGGLPEGVVPNETGWVFNEEDPEELATCLDSAFREPRLVDDMRSAAAQHARNHFEWSEIARQFLETVQATPPSTHKKRLSNPKTLESPKSIAVFYVRLPQFDRYGGDFRAFRLIRALAKAGHRVSLFARDSLFEPVETERYRKIYEELGVEVHILNRVIKRSHEWIRIPLANLDDLLDGRNFDAAWILWWNLASEIVSRLRKLIPTARIVIDSVDIANLRLLRRASLHEDEDDWHLAASTRRHELDAYRAGDVVITVTDDDAAVLTDDLPTAKVAVVPNVHPIVERSADFDDRRDVLFVGFFEHLPNTDAALFFTTQIWPLVKKELPEVKLYLVGNAPPPEIQSLATKDIIVTGYVPDLGPYWQMARLSIAPLRYGAGMKGKIGQSMAEGLPVVTTSIGTEGMELSDQEQVLIADTPGDFAAAVVRGYTDRSLWQKLSEQGRRIVRERWSDEVVRDHLLEALVGSGATHVDDAKHVLRREARSLASVAMGHEWLKLGFFHSARSVFQECIQQYPDSHSAFVGLSELEERAGRIDRALEHIQEAARLNPNHPAVNARLSNLLRRSGHQRHAQFQLERATALAPDHPLVLQERAFQAAQRGEARQAARLYRQVLERNPQHLASLIGAAKLMIQLGEAEVARSLLLPALRRAETKRDPSALKEVESLLLTLDQQSMAVPETFTVSKQTDRSLEKAAMGKK